jgi:hypothetical protein
MLMTKSRCVDCGKVAHKCRCPHSEYAQKLSARKDFFAAEAMKEFIARRRGKELDKELMSAIAQEAWEMAEEMVEDD